MRNKNLGIYLKVKRVEAELSQNEVAKVLGYKSAQFISNWERGISAPPVKVLPVLCKMYKVDPEAFAKEFFELEVLSYRDELKREVLTAFKLKSLG